MQHLISQYTEFIKLISNVNSVTNSQRYLPGSHIDNVFKGCQKQESKINKGNNFKIQNRQNWILILNISYTYMLKIHTVRENYHTELNINAERLTNPY